MQYFETSAANDPKSIKSMFAWLGDELAKHPDVGMQAVSNRTIFKLAR